LERGLRVTGADVELARLRAVRRGAPAASAADPGCDGREALRAEGREDAADPERPPVGRDPGERALLRTQVGEVVADRDRLRARRVLERALRYRPLLDPDRRPAVPPQELVHPAGLARLGDDLAARSRDPRREEHGVRRAVVVPDVVMDDLVVPRVG